MNPDRSMGGIRQITVAAAPAGVGVRLLRGVACMAAVLSAALSLHGQGPGDAFDPATTRPSMSREKMKDAATDRRPMNATTRPADDLVDPELVKKLFGGESSAEDAVVSTLSRMRKAADRLAGDYDPGAETQSLQREALAGMEKMIEAAEKAASSPSAPQSKRRRMTRPDRAKPAGGRKEAGTPRKGESAKQGGGTKERRGGRNEKGDSMKRADLERLWGFLPDQDRDEMIQGFDEAFLPKYRDEIMRYYRTLSIEASKE